MNRLVTHIEAAEILRAASASDAVRSGGNSRVARVEWDEHTLVVKDYTRRADGRARLDREWMALSFLSSRLPGLVPDPIWRGRSELFAIHSWLPGDPPALNRQSLGEMLMWIERLDKLHRLEPNSGFSSAVDAISSVMDVADQVQARCEQLTVLLATSSEGLLEPRVHEILTVLNRISPLFSGMSSAIDGPTNRVDTLSPSDFGPHNLLTDGMDSCYRMVDLEFFGVDDAHKLVCDTILHPQVTWTAPLLEAFIDGTRATLGTSDARLERLMPLLCLKWATIVLNRTVRSAATVDVSRREPSVTQGLSLTDYYLRLAQTVRHEDRLELISELPKRNMTPDQATE